MAQQCADTPWHRVVEHAAFPARDSAGHVVYQDKLWLVGGCSEDAANDRYDVVYNDAWTCRLPGGA